MGDEPPRLEDDHQRAMVSEWLGELHTTARDLAAVRLLPDRGARHYLALLDLARARLVDRRVDALRSDDDRSLGRAIGLCELLRSRWDVVERQAESLSPTFVHGDIAPENLRIVRSSGRQKVTAIDWEKAGLGTPFADLAITDPRAYAGAAGVPLKPLNRSMWLARLLAALSHNWASKPMSEVERYAGRLERALGSIDEH
jgi:aminoglycoside phosphotransferase (APT) family kinase protein